jgi:rare lipoprotein A
MFLHAIQGEPMLLASRSQTFNKWALFICLAVLSGLFCGCATKQSVIPSLLQSDATIHRAEGYRHKAAYNRPYRIKGKMYYPMTSAMGTRFRPHALTAAHKTLPLPSKVRVTNLNNGRSVVVLVNDRGPFKKGRLIDLSHGAARRLGVRGVARVKVEYAGNQLSSID